MTQVYRLSESEIGCSLAEAAERRGYEAWLKKASETANSMHVVYINTSLVTKALSQVTHPRDNQRKYMAGVPQLTPSRQK